MLLNLKKMKWKNIKKIMENVIKIDVPLTVEIGIGKTWLEAH